MSLAWVRGTWQSLCALPLVGPCLRFLGRHWLAVVAVVCIFGLVLGVNPSKLAGVLRKTDWRIALLMIPVTLATYVLRGTAWWLALRKIGERITLVRCLAVEFAGQVMIFLPMGDLARVAMARRSVNRPPAAGRVAGTIAFQELVYLTLVGLRRDPADCNPAGNCDPGGDHDARPRRRLHHIALETCI